MEFLQFLFNRATQGVGLRPHLGVIRVLRESDRKQLFVSFQVFRCSKRVIPLKGFPLIRSQRSYSNSFP